MRFHPRSPLSGAAAGRKKRFRNRSDRSNSRLRLLKTIATDFRRQRKLLPEGEVTRLARYLDINADAKIMLLREELDVLEQKTEQAIETYVEQKYL